MEVSLQHHQKQPIAQVCVEFMYCCCLLEPGLTSTLSLLLNEQYFRIIWLVTTAISFVAYADVGVRVP